MPHIEPEILVGNTSADPRVGDFLSALQEPTEIIQIAEMEIRDYSDKGLFIYFNVDQQVVSVSFWGMQDEDHKRYEGKLPRNISFNDGQKEIAEKLGSPSRTGWLNGSNVPWERFDFDSISIHIQYFPNYKEIQLVTLMSPALARGEF